VSGVDYDSAGRVDAALIVSLVPDLDAEFYLCGPAAFLTDVHMGLTARGVAADRIHTETFGPVG
jgi:ferredoxin-NADP reductase